MDNEKKIKLLEETFEVDEGSLYPEMELDALDNWDSMTKLALIVMVENEFGIVLSGETIRSFNNISDILYQMQ